MASRWRSWPQTELQVDDETFLAKLIVGIGEVSAITGIPQRQIHYWQSKGYIQPAATDSSVRRYTYPMIKKMILIKELLDEGYTLEASVRKVDERHRKIDEAVSRLRTAKTTEKTSP
jgi:DNA-binding transcriptional MerR regulator